MNSLVGGWPVGRDNVSETLEGKDDISHWVMIKVSHAEKAFLRTIV